MTQSQSQNLRLLLSRTEVRAPQSLSAKLRRSLKAFRLSKDLSATSLKRGSERIIQEGAAAEKVHVANPDPSTEAALTSDHVSEGMH